MKYSKAFIPTLREAPNDAEVISHKLLARAGMIRKVAMGIYDFLPLGLKSLKKIENIVREEMNRAGAQEIVMPHLIPAELWQESGRWQKYGKELLRIKDRHDREYCFGPTHEEPVCEMVRGELKSYRQLPLHLYQIQTKFRDEIRPRFGLMRGREFLMKDGYSFHATDEDLAREYKVMHQTYLRIFERCGLASRAVQADSGAIGGSLSHEFMVLAETGEDLIASCESCEYAANVEKAKFHKDFSKISYTDENVQDVSTPNKKTIEEVSQFLKINPEQMIKTLVYKADDVFVIVCVAGNREVSEIKLQNTLQVQEELRLATDEEIQNLTDVAIGFLGPIGLAERIQTKNPKAKFKILYDESVLFISDAVTGANKADHHKVHVNVQRDLELSPETSHLSLGDFVNILENDICPECQTGKLKLMRGIEVGHIFQLGRKYSDPMNVRYLDESGKEQIPTMGCYGIGVSRVLAACVEQSHDKFGIIWPKALAPYQVLILTMGPEENLTTEAQKIYESLHEQNIEVIWDDRNERAGVKFNDADLIGIPLQIILGKKSLERGEVEFKIRKTGEKGNFAKDEVLAKVQEILKKIDV